MTQDLETTLRRSLDHVDRVMKLFLATWLLMFILVVAGLLWLNHLSGTADVRTMLIYVVVVILFAQSVTMLLSCVLTTSMTRKILKAIELLSRE